MLKEYKIIKEYILKNIHTNGIRIAKYFSYISLGVNYGFK
tara:strand:- start:1 stop:120 length:120 start_codon:yes stop_codon:yes gene_type:complete